MPVQKQSRLNAQLEDLRRERRRLHEQIMQFQKQIQEIDGVIHRYLKMKASALQEERETRQRSARKKK